MKQRSLPGPRDDQEDSGKNNLPRRTTHPPPPPPPDETKKNPSSRGPRGHLPEEEEDDGEEELQPPRRYRYYDTLDHEVASLQQDVTPPDFSTTTTSAAAPILGLSREELVEMKQAGLTREELLEMKKLQDVGQFQDDQKPRAAAAQVELSDDMEKQPNMAAGAPGAQWRRTTTTNKKEKTLELAPAMDQERKRQAKTLALAPGMEPEPKTVKQTTRTPKGMVAMVGRFAKGRRMKTLALAPAMDEPPKRSPKTLALAPPTLVPTLSRPGVTSVRGARPAGHVEDEVSELQDSQEDASSTAIPRAHVVEEEEEVDREFIERLVHAEPALPEELEEPPPTGAMAWMKRNKRLTAIGTLVIVGAIVGGVVGASVGPSSPAAPPPTSAPSEAPSASPSMAPTFADFDLVASTLSQITPTPIMTNPSTPQYAAVNWLLLEDAYDLNFTDAPKLLQRYGLATIYFATGGANWTMQAQFLSNQQECHWNETVDDDREVVGVQRCDAEGFVEKLQLSQNKLDGTLPEEIAGLHRLDFVAAWINRLKGSIPSSITNLTNLNDIRLFDNQLSGLMPTDFGSLSAMTLLAMQSNKLSGPLPSSLAQWTSLVTLRLDRNKLSGTVPSELAAMTSLKNVYLEYNDFVDGMETFCTDAISLDDFRSDCYTQDIPFIAAEVECSCCTQCCADENGCHYN